MIVFECNSSVMHGSASGLGERLTSAPAHVYPGYSDNNNRQVRGLMVFNEPFKKRFSKIPELKCKWKRLNTELDCMQSSHGQACLVRIMDEGSEILKSYIDIQLHSSHG